MRILITGANGFVGRALCEKLVSNGWLVRGTVRSPKDANSLPSGCEAAHIDSTGSKTDWTGVLEDVDIVVHLAARAHVMTETHENSLYEFRRINTEGTKRLAQMSADAGIKRLIFISSIKVNGEGTDTPYTEQDKPSLGGPYAISKWEAEQALRKISSDTGLEIVIIRPPLVYGPGVKANFLRLLQLVERGIPLPLKSINNRRSFIYLWNLVDAIVICTSHPKAAGQTYLVSDGEDISTADLFRRLAQAMGAPARLIPFPSVLLRLAGKMTGRSAELERLLGSLRIDNSKIRNELGWTPPYTIQQGLKETIDWYLSR
ncbi:MAG: SDR family oxidoreductase [Nitrospirota bacterium]